MVIIESAETEENRNANANASPTKAASSSMANESAGCESSRDASDGFETASDGDVTDSDNEEMGGKGAAGDEHKIHEEQKPQQQHQHPQPPPQQEEEEEGSKHREPIVAGTENDSNDDELKQKALERANGEKSEGNKLFGNGQYEEALLCYERALQLAPDIPSSVELRSICHANRAICFLKLAQYENTIKECTKALELNPTYLKALVRRGEAHEKLEHFEEAIVDMKKILELDPLNDQAKKTIRCLEPLATEKREKMKEEMISKLKDMGNSILGRFGMSVDNFKAVQDPNTGSYSIQFQR